MDLALALVEEDYDAVLDTQGLIKSVMVARWVEGERYGYSRQSAREPFASRFYDRTFEVPKDLHAVTRNRLLAAARRTFTRQTFKWQTSMR